MTSQGSAYSRFRRALDTGNLTIIRAAAAELPTVRLDDALRICVVVRNREPHRYEQAAVRWLSRWCLERPGVTLQELQTATLALEDLRTAEQTGDALRVLRDLSRPRPPGR